MSDINRLTAALSGRYAIQNELGQGGMATVYLAHDVKHDRKVAVKVLRPELSAALGPERFIREIRIAARLQHPHILPLHDSGELDGFLFYVMPYVEGETLADRLKREKQLPLEDVLTIATEVAGALAYAHDQGVVHRDIKPANIMLSGGHGVVADFGIARAISAAGGEELTRTGMAVGTPVYMSPEQAAGTEVVDGRSDIYALGCVVYEMLAGEPPFTGPSAQAIIARHATDTPHALRTIRSTLPAPVEAAITRAMGKSPADRFQTAAEFAAALNKTESDQSSRISLLKVGLAVIGAALAVVIITVAVGMMSRGNEVDRTGGLPKLAVLPIENLGTADDEILADGITEEITSRIAEIRGLRVVSRTSAKRYKGSDAPIPEIGEALRVEYVLEGTLRTERAPTGISQVRVTSRLIKASDDTQLWTNSYGASLAPGEMFALQADIAEQVAGALNVTLSESEREAVRLALTEDSVAYDLYRRGRHLLEDRTPDGLAQSQELFRNAIARDAGFAAAHAGLADAISLYNFWVAPEQGTTAWAPAEAAARQAVALDPDLAEAHASLALALTYGRWDWEGARTSFQRAVDLDPDNAVAWYWYAEVDWVQRRLDSALAKLARAVELDPLSPVANSSYGSTLILLGRRAEGVQMLSRGQELAPTRFPSYWWAAWSLAPMGRVDEVRANLQRFFQYADPSQPVQPGLVDATARVLNGRADLATVVQAVEGLESYGMDNANVALTFAYAGIPDSAFARLNTAVDRRSEQVLVFLNFYYEKLGDDPRWDSILARMGVSWD